MNQPQTSLPTPVPSATNLANFGSYSPEEAQRTRQEVAASRNTEKLTYFKFPDPINYVRFLPPPPGATSPFLKVSEHWVEINGKKFSFACPRVMTRGARPCPACMLLQDMLKGDSAAAHAYVKKAKSKLNNYSELIDLLHPETGTQVARFGVTIKDGLAALVESGNPYWHPVEGCGVQIHRFKEDPWYQVKVHEAGMMAATIEEINTILTDRPDISVKAQLYGPEEIVEIIRPISDQFGVPIPGMGGQVAVPPQAVGMPAQPVAAVPMMTPGMPVPPPPTQPVPQAYPPAPVAQPVPQPVPQPMPVAAPPAPVAQPVPHPVAQPVPQPVPTPIPAAAPVAPVPAVPFVDPQPGATIANAPDHVNVPDDDIPF